MKVKGLKTIRYRCNFNYKLCRLGIGRYYLLICSAFCEKLKFMNSWGNMVAMLKFKEINERALLGVNSC